MSKVSLAVVAVSACAALTALPPLTARAQTVTRIEYLRVETYITQVPTSPNSVQERFGYHACIATAVDWACRDFGPTNVSKDALRTTFVTLGNEGWELVSAVKEEPGQSGLTYLFKRYVR